MYRLIIKDDKGFAFCYYSAVAESDLMRYVDKMNAALDWEITYETN